MVTSKTTACISSLCVVPHSELPTSIQLRIVGARECVSPTTVASLGRISIAVAQIASHHALTKHLSSSAVRMNTIQNFFLPARVEAPPAPAEDLGLTRYSSRSYFFVS